MTELYKDGIIEVTEAQDEDEDEDLFEVAVHFDGDIFIPNVVFESTVHALRQAKKLYDWLEANPKEIKGYQLRWQSYTVNRESPREYPACHLPYYYSKYKQSLEVLVSERDQEAIACGWLSAEPLSGRLPDKPNYYLIKYFPASDEEVTKYFSGVEVHGISDALSSVEIVAEVDGDVSESLNFWAKKKGYTLIEWENLKAENIAYIELNLSPTSYDYLEEVS